MGLANQSKGLGGSFFEDDCEAQCNNLSDSLLNTFNECFPGTVERNYDWWGGA